MAHNECVVLSDAEQAEARKRLARPLRPGALATLNEQFVLFNDHVFRPQRRVIEFTSGSSKTMPNTYIPEDIRKLLEDFPDDSTAQGENLSSFFTYFNRKKSKDPQGIQFANTSEYRTEFQPFPPGFLQRSSRFRSGAGVRPPYGTLLEGDRESVYQADYQSPRALKPKPGLRESNTQGSQPRALEVGGFSSRRQPSSSGGSRPTTREGGQRNIASQNNELVSRQPSGTLPPNAPQPSSTDPHANTTTDALFKNLMKSTKVKPASQKDGPGSLQRLRRLRHFKVSPPLTQKVERTAHIMTPPKVVSYPSLYRASDLRQFQSYIPPSIYDLE